MVKSRNGGNTPKRVYYHRMGALGGLFGANLSAKSAKKAPKTESGIFTHLCFGLIWGDLVARLPLLDVPNYPKLKLVQKSMGGCKDLVKIS